MGTSGDVNKTMSESLRVSGQCPLSDFGNSDIEFCNNSGGTLGNMDNSENQPQPMVGILTQIFCRC